MFVDDLARTRRSLHAVAEHLLAGPQHRAEGDIRLRVSPDGFRTWSGPPIAVVGLDVVRDGVSYPIDGHSARDLGAALGLDVGAPIGVYPAVGGPGVDEPLAVDAVTARIVAVAYAHGDAALRLLAPHEEPVLWPEHFDVGIRVEGVNYGVSPGDDYLTEPYAYVGVDPVPAEHPYWNAPFGAARPMTELADARSVHAFFVDARQRAAAS